MNPTGSNRLRVSNQKDDMKKFTLSLVCLLWLCTAWSQTARVQIIHNSPSPTVDIWVNNTPFLTNFEFRKATPYVDVPAGVALDIGVAPSPSDDPSDIIANFNVTFNEGETYVVIATGIVGNTTTPFNLKVVEGAREAATTSGNVDLIVYHGSTDAPAVDVIAKGVATLVENAAYGDVTNYITVPAGDYILDITPAGQPATVVASFSAPLSSLGGGAAVVFASGFLAPAAGQPAFGLFATLPDGTTIPLDVVNPTKEAADIKSLTVSPNPASDFLSLEVTLTESSNLQIQLLDLTGKQVPGSTINSFAAGSFRQTLALDGVNPGMYFLMIQTARGTSVRKVVII
jgi:hypothetical protein